MILIRSITVGVQRIGVDVKCNQQHYGLPGRYCHLYGTFRAFLSSISFPLVHSFRSLFLLCLFVFRLSNPHFNCLNLSKLVCCIFVARESSIEKQERKLVTYAPHLHPSLAARDDCNPHRTTHQESRETGWSISPPQELHTTQNVLHRRLHGRPRHSRGRHIFPSQFLPCPQSAVPHLPRQHQ
jgi:hypothetical protein